MWFWWWRFKILDGDRISCFLRGEDNYKSATPVKPAEFLSLNFVLYCVQCVTHLQQHQYLATNKLNVTKNVSLLCSVYTSLTIGLHPQDIRSDTVLFHNTWKRIEEKIQPSHFSVAYPFLVPYKHTHTNIVEHWLRLLRTVNWTDVM